METNYRSNEIYEQLPIRRLTNIRLFLQRTIIKSKMSNLGNESRRLTVSGLIGVYYHRNGGDWGKILIRREDASRKHETSIRNCSQVCTKVTIV